jgi:hypothetical protein
MSLLINPRRHLYLNQLKTNLFQMCLNLLQKSVSKMAFATKPRFWDFSYETTYDTVLGALMRLI